MDDKAGQGPNLEEEGSSEYDSQEVTEYYDEEEEKALEA